MKGGSDSYRDVIRAGNWGSARAVACMALAAVLFTACSIDERKLERAEGSAQGAAEDTGAGGEGPSTPSEGTDPLAVTCVQDGDCASSFCSDGVCCSSSCDLVCMACNTPGNQGSCTVVGSDPECGGRCPQSTDCLAYGSGAVLANCQAAGECRVLSVEECGEAPAPMGTSCAAGAGSCNDGGACAVAGKKLLGEACNVDDECAEGHCVVSASGASLCCTTACDGPCQACSESGRCKEVPAGDALCAPVDCPADNLCRDYTDDLSGAVCRGFGECSSVRDCKFVELRPALECACDAAGACTLVTGAVCSDGAECRTGLCQATVAGAAACCAVDCAAQGLLCSNDGASCVQCAGSASECAGPATSRTCVAGLYQVDECGASCDTGTGLCTGLKPLGDSCVSSSECGSTLCAPDVNGTSRCCAPSCGAGRVCGEDGSCVCPAGQVELNGECRLSLGSACSEGVECASGSCVAAAAGGSVCCDVPCAPGTSCAADGSRCVECEGTSATCAGDVSQTCVNELLQRSPCGNGCNPGTGFCNGLLGQGEICSDDSQCGSGLCDTDTQGSDRCCPSDCAATGRVCGSDGSCVCPLGREFVRGACRLIPGQSCTMGNACSSGNCVNSQFGGSVCCTGTCAGLLCRGTGQGCVQCEGSGSRCEGNVLARCQSEALARTTCGNGCSAAGGEASCNPLRGRGATCTQNAQCAAGLECGAAAGGTRCCDPGCSATGRSCDANGRCQCPQGQAFSGTRCGVDEGGACTRTSDCLGNLPCTSFFLDNDFDGFGSELRRVCGTTPPPPVSKQGVAVAYVPSGGDCCDVFGDAINDTGTSVSSAAVFPGQTVRSAIPAVSCAVPFDFNCDGVVSSPTLADFMDLANPAGCAGTLATCRESGGVVSVAPTCPGVFSFITCTPVAAVGGCVTGGNAIPILCL